MAPPLAIAAILGGLLGTLALPGLVAGLALALLVALAMRRYRLALLIAVLAMSVGQVLLARGAQLPQGLSRADLTTQVRIISLSDEGRFTRLRLAVEHCRPHELERPSCAALEQVRVSWYDPPALAVNDRWRLTLRLRPPAGFANPDSFDYGAWLWREGIGATGYVRDSPSPQRLAIGEPGLRQVALGYLDRHVADRLARRWLAALTLGAAERLDSADWELLNATGTTHVMVISGLHVGLVAALVLGLTRGLARLVTPRRWRLTTWPWWCAAAAAIGYAVLAGLKRGGPSVSSCGACGVAEEAQLMFGLTRLPARPPLTAAALERGLESLNRGGRAGLHTALGLDEVKRSKKPLEECE